MIGMIGILGIIASIIITLVLGILIRSIFYSLVHPELKISGRKLFSEFGQILKLLKENSLPSKKSDNLLFQLTPLMVLIIEIFISVLIPITILKNFSNWDISILFSIILLISINLIYIILNLTFKEITKIYSVKSQINLLVRDFLPLLLSIISIFIIFSFVKGDFNIPSFSDIVDFQNTHIIILGMNLPAIFIILNPFAAISFILVIVNVFKLRSSNKLNTEMYNSWDPLIEFSGRGKGYSLIGESMKFFIFSTIFIGLFVANGQFITNNSLYTVLIYLLLLLLFVLLIGFICKRDSHSKTTMSFRVFLNPSMLLALISLIFSIIVVNFNLIQIIPL